MENCLSNARLLSKSLEATSWYTCLSEIHKPKSGVAGVITGAKQTVAGIETESSAGYIAGLPVVSFRLSDSFRKEFPNVKQESVSLLLRARQWIIPNYALPPNENQTEILRIVIRESMSLDLLDRLISDIVSVTENLMEQQDADLSALKHKSAGHAGGSQSKQKDSEQPTEKGVTKRLEDGIHRSVC